MKLIGLSGYAQSGKDTVAALLTEHHGYTRRAFADPLREALYRLNPWLAVETYTNVWRVRYADLIDRWGYEVARKGLYGVEIRRLLQVLGTEVGRNLLGADVWVRAGLDALDAGHAYVFTDCRFPNEAQAIVDAGGEVWRVERPGYGPVNDHPSETALDDWGFDARIYNAHDLDYLARAVDHAVNGSWTAPRVTT